MAEDKKDNVYSSIFVSGDSLDRDLLAKAVAPYIRIYSDLGNVEIVFQGKAEKLTNRQKLLVYLLARKILEDTNQLKKDEKEGLTPAELEDKTHISGGSIRPVLANMLKERLVQKDESHYYVPNYSVDKVALELEEN